MNGIISIIDKMNLGQVKNELQYNDIYELASAIETVDWSPGIFNNRRRLNENFKRSHIIAFDVDENITLTEGLELFKDYKHIIGTSRNHQKLKNNKICDRFRVILFPNKIIEAPDGGIAEDIMTAINAILYNKFKFVDPQCKDPARLFYPCKQVVSINEDGKLLEIPDIIDTPKEGKMGVNINITDIAVKGTLWKSTLEFLHLGAVSGARHGAMVKAVQNMAEQGYNELEVREQIEEMLERTQCWPDITKTDWEIIPKVFNKARSGKLKHEFKARSEEDNLVVTAESLFNGAVEALKDKDKMIGEPTGIAGLDKLLGGGARLGELTVLMAQAKTGKNTLYHYMMHRQLSRGMAHGYASRELSPDSEVLPNLFAIELGKNVWTKDLNDKELQQLKRAVNSWQLYFAPGYGHFDLKHFINWINILHTYGIKYFWIDHFHYMLRNEEYTQISELIRHIKTLCKELDIHINLIVQPTKLGFDQRLSLDTLRGGAAIGQALDNLLIFERVRSQNQDNISRLKLEVGRHKLTRTGEIYLQYEPESTTFVEVQKEKLDFTNPNKERSEEYYKDKKPSWPKVQ